MYILLKGDFTKCSKKPSTSIDPTKSGKHALHASFHKIEFWSDEVDLTPEMATRYRVLSVTSKKASFHLARATRQVRKFLKQVSQDVLIQNYEAIQNGLEHYTKA